jgi:hypothetical protein
MGSSIRMKMERRLGRLSLRGQQPVLQLQTVSLPSYKIEGG